MNIEESIEKLSKKTPFILKLVALVILVEGLIGFLFYSAVLIYQIFDPRLLSDWGYNYYSGNTMIWLLFLQDMAHLGLIISAVLLLRGKRTGYFVSLLTFCFTAILWYVIHLENGWFGTIAALFMAIILTIYYKRLT